MNEFIKKYYLDQGYNCAETMLLAARDLYNLLIDETHIKILSGFGGGMYEEDICGAISGGVAVLSFIFSKDELGPLVIEFKQETRKKLSSIDCKEIKPIHRDKELGCNNVIENTFNTLVKIIKENKKRQNS
jgi:C_GCAxxG_C_C family probable redox protein